MTDTSRPGRRASVTPQRRVDLLVALAVVAPAVVAISVGLVGGESNPTAGPQAPTTAALTSSTVVCPAGLSGADGSVRVARAPDVAGGELAVASAPVTRGDATTSPGDAVAVEQGRSIVVPRSDGATVLDGKGAAAPGIAAGRDGRLALPECRAPGYDEWLVGVGASARSATTVELVNPDDGDAVVDLVLHGDAGPVDEPALRGLEVPPHGVRRIDLATLAPREKATAAHLTVVRGRVTATARTTYDPLGRGRVTTDFLPADADPATDGLILGVPAKPVRPTLHLANPGDDEVRVTPRFVTEDAAFTPSGAPEITVAPQSIRSVDLSSLLKGAAAQGVVGIQVEATAPVASSFEALVQDDLVLLAPTPEVREPTAVVVPTGAKTLVLGGALRTGVVHVASYDPAGKELADERVEIGPDRAASVKLPSGAVAVTVEARNTRIRGVVALPTAGRTPGLATLRLRPAELQAQIPSVRPE